MPSRSRRALAQLIFMLPPSPDSFAVTATFVRYEERFGVLMNEALGEFRWPLKNLPEGVKVGDSVTLKIITPNTEQEEKYLRMRKLLEELIN